jgi:ATP synthase protein I
MERVMTVRERNRAPKGKEAGGHDLSAPDLHDSWDAEAQDKNIVPLTRAEAETLFGPGVSRPSRVTPFKVVAAQMVLSLCATLAWWLFYRPPGVAAPGDVPLSAMLGGAICWVPSGLFAARLKAKSGAETIASWMIGEAMKMGSTIAMFIGIAVWYKGVLWVPLLITYLVALKTYWIAMALK